MPEAFITPELLRWARDRRELSSEVLAKKIGVSLTALNAWEKGEARPTLRQAQVLANRLSVPFGYLYLSSPPKEDLPIADFRTVAGMPPLKPSPEFLDVLHDVLRKQQWYREYLRGNSVPALKFIGRYKIQDEPETIAADIRESLGINDKLREECKTWEQFLARFVRRAENERILVLRSSIVGSNTHRHLSVDEFRGFAISDDFAPLVFVNSADARAAQIFTLAHELAHLWLGRSGISNLDYSKRSSKQLHVVDRICDKVAAEVLAPAEDFVSRWGKFHSLGENIDKLASRYRVSSFVVLRRAYELGCVSTEDFRAAYTSMISRAKRKGTEGGGDFYLTLLSRNSVQLTASLLAAAAEGRISPREAAGLLNIRVTKLEGIEHHIFLGRAADA